MESTENEVNKLYIVFLKFPFNNVLLLPCYLSIIFTIIIQSK